MAACRGTERGRAARAALSLRGASVVTAGAGTSPPARRAIAPRSDAAAEGYTHVPSPADITFTKNYAKGPGVIKTHGGYDAASRLDSLTQNLAGAAHDLTTTFNHNPAGQVSSRTASNDLYAWTDHTNMDNLTQVNGRNQVTSEGGVSFSYDARGNLTSDGVNTYGYDADNRLTSASGGAAVKYDALGRLFEASASGLSATQFLCRAARALQSCRNACATGSRAARIAGKRPPTNPMMRAAMIPCSSRSGVTAKSKTTWLKLAPFNVDTRNPLNTA